MSNTIEIENEIFDWCADHAHEHENATHLAEAFCHAHECDHWLDDPDSIIWNAAAEPYMEMEK